MKLITKILVAVILWFTIQNTKAQIAKAEIMATGLTCSMCSNAIYKQLIAQQGVEKVGVDLNTNTFVVFLNKNNQVTPKILKEKVEKAGFFVGSMVIYLPFENLKITDNLLVKENNLSLTFIKAKPKTLNGITPLKILNKGYVTQKEYKKTLKSFIKYSGFETENKENYHVKLL